MKKVELLSPAGNKKCLQAAIEAGADAVYLAGLSFGARAYAANFTNEELIEAIKYAHLYGVKVYVTANTLIYDEEVDEFLNYIEFLHKNNVDAIIMQDLGMIDLVRKTFPNLEIHASTQMHIHNLDAVEFIQKQGVKRVVLAREVNIEEIKEIKKKTNVEIELFVHGALCVCYSGQCLLSSLIGGRSGNKGACAGSCRLPYTVLDEKGNKLSNDNYPLSMKDLNTLEYIDQLLKLQIDSIKIEGRMKSPSYVYLATSLYRKAIDSYYNEGKVYIDEKQLHDLMITFNRKYTKGFLFNEDNNQITNPQRPNHQGIELGKIIEYKNKQIKVRLKEELNIFDGLRAIAENNQEIGIIVNEMFINNKLVKTSPKGSTVLIKVNTKLKEGTKIYLTSSKYLDKKIETNYFQRKVPINITIKAKENKPFILTVTDNKNTIRLEKGTINRAQQKPVTKKDIIDKISKITESVYQIDKLNIDMDDNIFFPMSQLNDLRREMINKLNDKRLYQIPFKKEKYKIEVPNYPQKMLKTLFIDGPYPKNNNYLDKYDEIYTTTEESNTTRILPRVISDYKQEEKKVMISELGGLNKLKNIETNFSLNVTNSYTVAFLHHNKVDKITISTELTDEQIKNLVDIYHKRYNKHPNLEVITYGYQEAMICKFSLNKKYNKQTLYLQDKYKNKYLVKQKDNCMHIYYYDLLDKRHINYYEMGINSTRENIIK